MRAVALAALCAALAGAAAAQVRLEPPADAHAEIADGGRFTLAFRADAAAAQTVFVRIDAPAEWRTMGARVVALEPGVRTLFVVVSPPPGTRAGTYPVDVALVAGEDTVAVSGVTVIVPARRSARVDVARPVRPLEAGVPTELAVTIANDGNVPLTLDLTPSAPGDWRVRLGQRSVQVEPGATERTTAQVTPPAGLAESRGARVGVEAADAGSALAAAGGVRVLAVPEPGALRLARHDLPGRVGVEVGSRSGAGGADTGALLAFDANGRLTEGGRTHLRVSVRAPVYGDGALAGRDLYRAQLLAPGLAATVGDAAVDHGPLSGVVLGTGAAAEVSSGGWAAGAFALGDRVGQLSGDRVGGVRAARTVTVDSTTVRVGASALGRTGPIAGSLVGLRLAVERGPHLEIDLEGGLGGGRGAAALGGAARIGVRRGPVRLVGAARATPASFPLLTAGTLDARGEAVLYLGRSHVTARGTRYRVRPVAGRVGLSLESARLSGRVGTGLQWEAGGTRYVRDDRALAELAARIRVPLRVGPLRGDLRAQARRRVAGTVEDDQAGADATTRVRLSPAAEALVGMGGSVSSRTGPAARPSLGAAVRPVRSLLVRATVFAELRGAEAQNDWGIDAALSWTDRSGRRLSARALRIADDFDAGRAGDRWQALLTLTQPLALPLAKSRASGAVRGRIVDPESGAGLGGVPVFVGGTAAVSAPDGTFALSGLAPGPYDLSVGATAAGASPFTLGAVAVHVGGGEVTTLADFAAPRGAELVGRALLRETSRTGRALDAPPQALSGVAVVVVGAEGAAVRGVTDADGGFRFVGLAPGRYVVRLDGDALPRGVTAPPVEVELASGAIEAVTLEAASRRRTFRQLD